jgi:hypothetical protein
MRQLAIQQVGVKGLRYPLRCWTPMRRVPSTPSPR